MYKLFLCLRYLRSRAFAYFAVAAVALCVWMMGTVTSVLNGFADKLEGAAKGLFGDIIIEPTTQQGLPLYDEFLEYLRERVPAVEAGSPFIFTYGMLKLPEQPAYQQSVAVAGVRLPERARVSALGDGLFVQQGWEEPGFAPSIESLRQRVEASRRELVDVLRRERQSPAADTYMIERLENARFFHDDALRRLRRAEVYQPMIERLRVELEEARREHGEYSDEVMDLEDRLLDLVGVDGWSDAGDRVILSVGIPGVSFHTPQGERVRNLLPGHKVILWIFPIGGQLTQTDITPNQALLSIVDDARSDVYTIDAEFVYVPFETLQRLNNMGPVFDAEDPTRLLRPARASQIHLKVAPEHASAARLERIARDVDSAWGEFRQQHPELLLPDVTVLTWRARQAQLLASLTQQRAVILLVLGIVCLVAVVLIFVILYTIVMQKTRDIGVLKAVGGSSGGAAAIFLGFGGAIGLVGALLGVVMTYFSVRNINVAIDTISQWRGERIFGPETFLFSEMPNQIDWIGVTYVGVGAIVAGVIGALMPAFIAARMQPVEALRYE